MEFKYLLKVIKAHKAQSNLPQMMFSLGIFVDWVFDYVLVAMKV